MLQLSVRRARLFVARRPVFPVIAGHVFEISIGSGDEDGNINEIRVVIEAERVSIRTNSEFLKKIS
jgi:hypothetical protein